MKRFFALVFIISAMNMMNPIPLFACASCGSGGDDPLILYPNEWLKSYLGLSQSSDFKSINPDGSYATAGGPELKQNLTVAGGYGFSPRSFMTLTMPFLRNAYRRGVQFPKVGVNDKNEERTSAGDPSLAGRYSLLLQTFDEPEIPQVQLVYGYKFARSRSIHESSDLKILDVFGTGFSEAKLGLDIWFGMSKVKPGFSQVFAYPMKRTLDGMVYQPGLISRTTVSLGYMILDELKFTFGVNRDQRRGLKVDGVLQEDSSQLNNSAFFSSDYKLHDTDTIRFSGSRLAAFGNNMNSARSDTVGLAYMHSF